MITPSEIDIKANQERYDAGFLEMYADEIDCKLSNATDFPITVYLPTRYRDAAIRTYSKKGWFIRKGIVDLYFSPKPFSLWAKICIAVAG